MRLDLQTHDVALPVNGERNTVSLDVESRLMHNYRVAAPVHAGSDIAAVTNAEGEIEIFTLGADSTIWHFRPDTSSASGYRGVSTDVQATTFAAGRDSAGEVTLFVGSLQEFYVLTEDRETGNWRTPRRIPYPAPAHANRIERIIVDEIDGQLHVGMLVRFSSAERDLFQLVFSVWNPMHPEFQRASGMVVDSVNCCWLGVDAAGASFACVDHSIVEYKIGSQEIFHTPTRASFTSLSVSATNSPSAAPRIFAVLEFDGKVSEFVPGASGQPGTWSQLRAKRTFHQVLAMSDTQGSTHVFAVSDDSNLFHWQPDTHSPEGFGDGTLIGPGSALVAAPIGRTDSLDLFVVGSAQSTLGHLYRESVSTDWVRVSVEVPEGGELEEYASYTSDVAVHDLRGALLTNTPVTLSVSEETRLSVNGAVHTVTPSRPVRTSTNAAGLLSIVQQAGSLAVPAIGIKVTNYMPVDDTLTIDQSAGVQRRLADVTGPELMEAKVADGGHLLPEEHRTPGTTAGLATALTRCMSLREGVLPRTRPLPGRMRSNEGVGLIRDGAVSDLQALVPPLGYTPWRLTFAPGRVVFEDLDQDSAERLLRARTETHPAVTGWFDWVDDIGDFVAGVVDGFIEVVETVVATVADAVEAAITCVIEGVTYVYHAVVHTIETAFDLAETAFAAVKVSFDKLFGWLGFLFEWDDILRTHKAMVYTVDQFLGFLSGAAQGAQRVVDRGMADLQNHVDEVFDDAVTHIAGDSSVGTYEESNRPVAPEIAAATANTVVFNAVLDNASGSIATSLGAPRLGADGLGAIDDLMAQLGGFATTTQESEAFTLAQGWFETLGSDIDEVFDALLSALLRVSQGVVKAMLSGAQVLVDALFGLARTLVEAVRDALETHWDIPLVSPLYRRLTGGSELTTLDLIALVNAVPTTIAYKLLHEQAPFPDDAALEAYKASFDTAAMLRASGLVDGAGVGAGETADFSLVLPQAARRLLRVGSGICVIFGQGFSGVLDLKMPYTPSVLSKAVFGLEVLGTVQSLPWFYADDAPGCTTPQGRGCVHWIYSSLGVLLDAAYVFRTGTLPAGAGDSGVVVKFGYGLGHLATAITASIGQSGAIVAGKILPVIPELAKPLRLTKVISATKGISLPVLAGIDVVCGVSAGLILATSPVAVERPVARKSANRPPLWSSEQEGSL